MTQEDLLAGVSKAALLDVAGTRHADRLAIASGTSGSKLMERAGAAVAALAGSLLRPGGRIAILCGPGNNGGDGFVAARLLHQAAYAVDVACLVPRDRLAGDAAAMAELCPVAIADPQDVALERADLIVDALFGAGLSRDLDGEARRLVERMNGAGRPILAVDLPSGVNGDSGAIQGVAVRADSTVTFVRLKPGHLLHPGRACCGRVTVADIGIPDAIVDATRPVSFANEPVLWAARFPRPAATQHKYRRGHALVVAGGIEGTGAARLAARAALRAGAGLVTLAVPPEAVNAHAARGPDALMTKIAPNDGAIDGMLGDPRLNAIVVGPALGVGDRTAALVGTILAHRRPTVLDADALTSFAGRADLLAERIKATGPTADTGPTTVITPHEGEFARLFCAGIDPAASKPARARAAATTLGAVVVLKGADTVIAAPDGRAAINGTGSPWLATAGSGDVLAGLIGGLLAQGMPPFEAAAAAVWLHADAGSQLGPGLIADDLPEAVPAALAALLGRI